MEATIERARRTKESPWFDMSRALAQDRSLSWEARGVMAYVLSKPDDWKVLVSDLQQGCGIRKVYGILKELREAGYISMFRLKNDQNQFVGVRYVVHEEPHCAFRNAENRNVDSRNAETVEDLHIRDQQTRDQQITERKKYLIADAIDDAASPLKDDELARMVAAKAALKARVEPPIENHPDEDIIGHRFTQYLLDEFKVGTVTKTVLKELKKPILIKVEGAPEPVETGTLLYYYGHVDGFKEFVEEVVPIMAKMPKQNMSLLNAIRFLANIEKKGGKLLHWNEWYEQNKRFIEPKYQPQKEKIVPVYGVEMPEEWKW